MARLPVIILACVPFVGCVTRTISSPQLDAQVAKHVHETVNWLDYMGTRDGFHYIRHSYTVGSKTYRIPVEQMHIEDPFPLTHDRHFWRPLKRYSESWPPGLLQPFSMPLQIQKNENGA